MSRCIACNDILSDTDLLNDEFGEYCLKCHHINLSALQDFEVVDKWEYDEDGGIISWSEDGNKTEYYEVGELDEEDGKDK